MQNIDSFSTSNIQAKLGDLVQDTNDIMNFDKALQALKSKRSSYIPLRGSGGSVADAERKMTNLQGQLEQAEGMFPELDKLQQEIEVLEGRREGLQTSLETTRKDITLSAEASARKTLEAQHQALQDRLKNSMEQLTQLQETYPAGWRQNRTLINCSRYMIESLKLEQSRNKRDGEKRRSICF